MKALSRLFLLMLFIAGSLYFFQESDFTLSGSIEKIEDAVQRYSENIDQIEFIAENEEDTAENTENGESIYSPEEESTRVKLASGLIEYIGEEPEVLNQTFGEPFRKDPSSYGYESWIYTDHSSKYIQAAVKNGKVQMIFAAGDDISLESASIGHSYERISELFDFKNELTLNFEGKQYRFQLNKEDMAKRPIVRLNENTFLQFYFDTFDNQLSSVRYINSEILLAHRPYEIHYRSGLPEHPQYNDQEWEEIQAGMEKQVFELTNVLRSQYGAGLLNWDESTAQVAYGHSKDMHENDYFSHYSLDGSGLKERLNEYDLGYFSAGENIAAQYTDSPAAVEGWLNSEGHREALLNDQYTHLGVGVYRYYYTQNFLQKN